MKPGPLLRSTAVVGAATAVSRLLGFVREVLMAYLFGTSLAKSAFDVAFRIPNLFRRLFGEGALSAAFVPVFTDTLRRDGREAAHGLAARVAGLLAATLALAVGAGILLILLAEHVLPLGERAAAVLPLLRIMLPYALFICMAALSMGILNAFGYFAIPALAPVLLNIVWVVALAWIVPRLGGTPREQIVWLAWCIMLAGVLQVAGQVPFLRRCGVPVRLSLNWRDARVRRVLLLMGPAALGMGVYQVNAVVDGVLALVVGRWAPAALTYAERLIYLPLGIIATALGTVLLPTFSHQAAADAREPMRRTLRLSLRAVCLAMTPAAVGLIVLVGPIVRLTYVWSGGAFDELSLLQTARALAFYSPGLLVFSLYKVIVPVFYALKDTRTPVRIGLWVVLLNFLLNIVFILTWPADYKHAGLAFATVLTNGLSCVVLGRLLHRRIGDPGWRAVRRSAWHALAGSALMAVAARFAWRELGDALAGAALSGKAVETVSVLGAIGVGLAVYAAWLLLVARDEFSMVFKRRA